jgi:hypothetical protein
MRFAVAGILLFIIDDPFRVVGVEVERRRDRRRG